MSCPPTYCVKFTIAVLNEEGAEFGEILVYVRIFHLTAPKKGIVTFDMLVASRELQMAL